MPASPSDPDITQRFEALWHAHYADVLAFVIRRIGDPTAAADITAESFAIAWRRFGSAPAPSRAWLLAIAHRVIANHFRGERRQVALVARVRASAADADAGVESESAALVAEAFNSLSVADREVLALVAWQELKPREAAEVIGVSAAVFSVRLHRAKRRLRKKLESSGHQWVGAQPITPEAPAPVPRIEVEAE